MKRDAFAVSAVAAAMALVMAMVAAAACAAPPQGGPTRKAADETKAEEAKSGDAKGDGKDKGGDKGGDRDKDKAADSGPPVCMHCGATCGLTPICVCEPGTKKKTRIEFESRCEPVCIAGCGGSVPRACCTDCRGEPCACPGRIRICNRLRAETVTDEVPAVVRTVRYVCRCCEASCDGPPRHPHRWPWASLAGWFRGWPVPWMTGR